MTTFITSKAIGETLTYVSVNTSTGFWKYNHNGVDSSVFNQNDGTQDLTVTNINGEFTIISCDETGNVSGDLTNLALNSNQLTSFDGTGLSGLTNLNLSGNELTTFDGTGLSSLTELNLMSNPLILFDGGDMSQLTQTQMYLYSTLIETFIGGNMTSLTDLNFTNWGITTLASFDGTGLSALTNLSINDNQLTSFDGTGLSALTYLELARNPLLTTFNGAGLSGVTFLYLDNNPITTFNGNGLTSLTTMYLMNGSLTSFDGAGLSSVTSLSLNYNQLTSFDGTSLSGLTNLDLSNNQLTSFDGTSLSALTTLYLNYNPITTFDGGDMSQITTLNLGSDNGITTLTSFDGGNMTSLNTLYLNNNPLTTFIGGSMSSLSDLNFSNWNITTLTTFNGVNMTGVYSLTLYGNTGLIELSLNNNQLTSFDGTGLTNLIVLSLNNNQLTSFDGAGLTSLIELYLDNNQLTSFDGTSLSSLASLGLASNSLTLFDATSLSSLSYLDLVGNPMTTSVNNQILQQLNQHGVSNGYFSSVNGRTAASDADYNNLLNNLYWALSGLDLVTPPVVGNGRLRVRGYIPTPSWNGGAIYNIGAVVTHEGQTWYCIQYAPAGYGPFGGYIDVYWSLGGTPPQVTHDELNANINGPSVLFRTHDFSMTMVQDGGKNDGKYSIHLDGKPFKSAMLQLNVGTPSAPCDSQYNDIVVAAIVFNSASTALAFKSNNNWPNGNVINFDNSPDINNEINEWGYFEGGLVGTTNGNPADINSYPDDAKMGELFGNNTILANSGYGPSDLDKIIIVICERDRATSQTVQYFEKWFAFELVGPEVYPNGWV